MDTVKNYILDLQKQIIAKDTLIESLQQNFKEIKDRINYFYLQIDGEYDFPNSKEGDLIKMLNKTLFQIQKGN